MYWVKGYNVLGDRAIVYRVKDYNVLGEGL